MRFVLAFLATGLVGALATGVRADVRVVPGTTKVLKGAPPAGLAQIDLEAARNEWVAFQVVITSPASPLGAVSVELTDLAGPGGAVVAASGAELSLEFYHPVDNPSWCEYPFNFTCPDHPEYVRTPGDYPDALIPFVDPYGDGHAPVGAPFDVAAGDLQTVFVDLFVPPGIAAGDYAGEVRVTAGGTLVKALPVTLHVWDFDLPSKRNVATAYGLGGNIWDFHAAPDAATRARIQRNYELAMHRHRIDPTDQGFVQKFEFDADGNVKPIDWTSYDAEVGPRIDGSYYGDGVGINRYDINMFTPGHSHYGMTDEQWGKGAAAVAAHLQEKGFLEHTYMYSADEPWMPTHEGAIADIAADSAILHQAAPLWNGHVLVTGPWLPQLDTAVDIWCPVTAMYGSVSWPAGQWPEAPKYQELIASGRQLWFYVCNADFPPSLGYDVDSPYGWEPRILKWRAWGEGATGFLYWRVTYWFDGDPWHHLADVGGFGGLFARNGDGVLLYPGDHKDGTGSPANVVIDGPVVSFRLKQVRDGIEDWELLLLAEQLGGGKYARAQIDRAVRAFGQPLNDQFDPANRPWSLDESVVGDVRRNLAAKVQYLMHPDLYPDPEPTVPDNDASDDAGPADGPAPEAMVEEAGAAEPVVEAVPDVGSEAVVDAVEGMAEAAEAGPEATPDAGGSGGGGGCRAAAGAGGAAGALLAGLAMAAVLARRRTS